MIGPVPANLEVFLSLAYGFKVGAYYSFTPAAVLLELFDDLGANTEGGVNIAKAGIKGKPYFAARVGLFVGVGFDVGIAAVKAGIEGIVSLAEISVPVTAGVGLNVDALDDARVLAQSSREVLGREIGFLVGMKKFQLSLTYDFGVGVSFTDILSGRINLKLKLKFLFFSKTWKRQIAKWSGFCPSNGSRDSWCDLKLFEYEGETELFDLRLPWATIKFDTVFPDVPRIKAAEYRAEGDLEINHSVAEDFGYCVQCGEIIVE
jgi:hypothetical protein